MSDSISRQAVQAELKNCEVVDVRDENDNFIGYYNADTVDFIVRNLPPVAPQPKMGRWIEIDAGIYNGFIEYTYRCSCCDNHIFRRDETRPQYCEWCGARMESEEQEK